MNADAQEPPSPAPAEIELFGVRLQIAHDEHDDEHGPGGRYVFWTGEVAEDMDVHVAWTNNNEDGNAWRVDVSFASIGYENEIAGTGPTLAIAATRARSLFERIATVFADHR